MKLLKEIGGSSGEGKVWTTDDARYVAKIYHPPKKTEEVSELSERFNKLQVMIANNPRIPGLVWPENLTKDPTTGKYTGFLMPAVSSDKTLLNIYNPQKRQEKAPEFNWFCLYLIARNLASIVDAVHRKGYVICDIKDTNILVDSKANVYIIDTDSFQIRDPKTKKLYRSATRSPDFTPPELLGKDLSAVDREQFHDLFGLGVIIYYLLFNCHPFCVEVAGVPKQLDIDGCIREGYWFHNPNIQICRSPIFISLDIVHPNIQKLFHRCFTQGHINPSARPTAKEWKNALDVAIQDLIDCPKELGHQYAMSYGKCYWCERKQKTKYDIFPTVLNSDKYTISAARLLSNINTPVVGKTKTSTTLQQPVTNIQSNSSPQTPATSPTGSTSYPTSIPSRSLSNTQENYAWLWWGGAVGVILFFYYAWTFNKNKSPLLPSPSPTYSFNFPMKQGCGDSDPRKGETWYPVFVENSNGMLARIKSNYCPKDDPQPNENRKYGRTTSTSIQVASFRQREKAEAFAESMKKEVGSGEVGDASPQ